MILIFREAQHKKSQYACRWILQFFDKSKNAWKWLFCYHISLYLQRYIAREIDNVSWPIKIHNEIE